MREQALLAQVRVLTEKHEVLAAASGQSFNLFALLGRETDEVHTHSAILAELLDPKGSHRQGSVFARLFADRFGVPVEGIESARVLREVTVAPGSRVDILLHTEDAMVVVENKIHAPDQPRQLERYHSYAKKWDAHKVIYLTLHGDEPGDDTLGTLSLDEVACLSYETDVLAWLDDCIKEVARVPQIREILAHYQALLRKLTGKATGELVMDLKALLLKEQDDTYNFELAPKIAEAMTALSVETEWRFWQTLKARLGEIGDRPWRLSCLDVLKSGSSDLKEVDESVIRHAHGIGNKNKWRYGWTFRIESDANPVRYRTDTGEVFLRIECDEYGWGFYGFIAGESTPEGKVRRLSRAESERLFEEWGKRLPALEGGWKPGGESWIAWTWPTEDLALQKGAGWLEPATVRRLVEEKAVTPLFDDIRATIDRVEGVGEMTAASNVS